MGGKRTCKRDSVRRNVRQKVGKGGPERGSA